MPDTILRQFRGVAQLGKSFDRKQYGSRLSIQIIGQ